MGAHPTRAPRKGLRMTDPRTRVRSLVDSSPFQWFIIGVIVINAAILGVETSPELLGEAP